MASPVVSVVTVVRNRAATIARTIKSIADQTYANIEYIVVDGASTDETLEVLQRYDDRITRTISEPDRGIADAFNKGLALSSGEYVTFVNADDWLSPDQIAFAVARLEETGAAFVFGDLTYHLPDGTTYVIRGDPDYARVIHRNMPWLNHPTIMVRREMYQRYGGFDTRYRIAMDYDFLLRLHRAGEVGVYDPAVHGHAATGGVSDIGYIDTIREITEIARTHGRTHVASRFDFLVIVVKAWLRRLLQRCLPDRVYHRVRRLFNRNYRATANRGGLGG